MSTTSSSSKGGGAGGGDSRRRQKQGNRGVKNIKDQTRTPRQDKPTEIPGQTPSGAPNEILNKTLEEAKDEAKDNTCRDLVTSPASEGSGSGGIGTSEIASYEGDNWETAYTGKILKRGRRRQENHDLPPLQIAGLVVPYKDKIARDNAAAFSQEEFNADIAERIQRGRVGEIPTGMTQGVQRNNLVA